MKALEIIYNSSKDMKNYPFDEIMSFKVVLRNGKEKTLEIIINDTDFNSYNLDECTWYIIVT